MTLHYENTLEDAIAYTEYGSVHTPTLRQNYQRLRSTVAALVTLSLFILLLFLQASLSMSLAFVGLALSVVAGFVFYGCFPAVWRWFLRYNAKNMMKMGGYKGFMGVCTLTLAPDGIHGTYPLGNNHFTWNAITSVEQSKDQIFLFFSEIYGVPIPRRAFTDPVHEAAFLAQIERYRTGAITVPTSNLASPLTSPTRTSNAPWWSGQTVSSVDADATTNTNQHKR